MNKYEDEMKRELDEIAKEDAQKRRESQRQEFIESLIQASYQRDRELNYKNFYLGLALVIIEYLKDRQIGTDNSVTKPDAFGVFLTSVRTAIENFAQTEMERDALMARFLRRIIDIGLYPFETAFSKGME